MKPPCPDCGRIHTYAATYPGAPTRLTRAHAERDMCNHRQEQAR